MDIGNTVTKELQISVELN
ncbi:hypothetical protein L1049_009688 [Liquidambar formosana]|uniref:Uncharacterized protein n=1 Tax=Liquidambar formosana TaxID=63359 RepID=A0AAP0N7Q5_LIQFO